MSVRCPVLLVRCGIVCAGMSISALMLVGCGQAEDAPQQLPVKAAEVHHVKDGKDLVEPLQVEIADDDHERATGLMFRKSMDADKGMLFVWPHAEARSFWMHETYIPLDLLFIREGRVVSIAPWAKPLDDTPLPSGEPADMVLEVNGGWTIERGVTVGDRVVLK
jgi:uncharacterized membrane protein (UPF0127 family)